MEGQQMEETTSAPPAASNAALHCTLAAATALCCSATPTPSAPGSAAQRSAHLEHQEVAGLDEDVVPLQPGVVLLPAHRTVVDLVLQGGQRVRQGV